jgi:hypothetical protein
MVIEIYSYRHGIRRKLQWGWRLFADDPMNENMGGNTGFNSPELARKSIGRVAHAFNGDLKKVEIKIKVEKK